MRTPDYWRPKETLPEIFCGAEAEAYGLFYGITKLSGRKPFRTVQLHSELPDHKIFEDIHSPVRVDRDPWGNEGEWRLRLRESRVVPPNPEDPNSPIEVQHNMAVDQLIGDEYFLVVSYERPRVDVRPVYGGRDVTLTNPLELLDKDLRDEINEQTAYMDWLNMAKARTLAN